MHTLLKIFFILSTLLALMFSIAWYLNLGNLEPQLAIISAISSIISFTLSQLVKEPEKEITEAEIVRLPEAALESERKEFESQSREIKINQTINQLQEKFLEVFEKHGIDLIEIPRVLPDEFNITLSDIYNSEKLISKLTPKVIDWCCKTFNVRREWFEKNNEKIYNTTDYYKDVESFLKLINELKYKHYDQFKVYLFKSVEELDISCNTPQTVNILISIPTINFEKQVIQKYIPTSTYWNWKYWRTRYQIKSIVRICEKNFNVRFCGYDLPLEKMQKLAQGNIFPGEIVSNFAGYTWYPEDYSDLSSESMVAKETGETEEIIKYIEKEDFLYFLRDTNF